MSLLMQALKKAEQIKQKQSGIVADEALTLSPKELSAEPEKVERVDVVEVADVSLVAAEQTTLTLSPHMEDKPSEVVSTTLELTHEAPPLAPLTPLPPAISLPENEVLHQNVIVEHVDAGKKEEKAVVDNVTESRFNHDLGGVEKKNISPPDLPKIGAEQKQITEQAEQLVLSEQKKAKLVFSSKATQGNQRRIRIGVYVLLSLLVVAVLAYVYWQNMSAGVSNTLLRTPPPLPIVVPAPAAIDAEAAVKAANPVLAQVAAASDISTTPKAAVATTSPSQASTQNAVNQISRMPGATVPTQSTSAPASRGVKFAMNAEKANANTEANEPAPSATNSSMRPKLKAAMATPIEESKAIQFRHNSTGNQVNPVLSSAYQNFIAGDAATAKLQYQKVLQQEPNNRDALLGMAAIALNQRQAEQAGSFYGRLLELDPGDPDAIAGLTSLQQGDPVQSESRLKKSLSQNPQAGAVLFALGNLYAQQSRWSDAQQTYFRAYATTPGNADYAFNLAVSLDKLNQVKLAREYYERALKLAHNSSGNFNPSDVEKRVTELKSISRE